MGGGGDGGSSGLGLGSLGDGGGGGLGLGGLGEGGGGGLGGQRLQTWEVMTVKVSS